VRRGDTDYRQRSGTPRERRAATRERIGGRLLGAVDRAALTARLDITRPRVRAHRHELTRAVLEPRHLGRQARRLRQQDLARDIDGGVELLETRNRLEPFGLPPRVLAGEVLALEPLALGLALLEIERDGLLTAHLRVRADLVDEIRELRIVRRLLLVDAPQHLDRRVQRVGIGPVPRRLNAVPGEGGVARALADRARIDACRQLDIRDHAAVLRALSGDAVVLADRQRQLPVIVTPHHAVEVEQVLNRALAERLLADDDAALVVLDRGGKDLGRARAVAVDEHDERAVVDRLLRARIVKHLNVTARFL